MTGRPLKILTGNMAAVPYMGRFGPIPGATLTGPDWGLPLANLQDDELSLIARSAGTSPFDTRFRITFTRLTALRSFFLANTNFTINAQIRLTGYNDAAGTSFSFENVFDAYPIVGYTEELEWEAENSWTGKPLSSDLEGYQQNAFTVFDEDRYCTALDVEIFDQDNPDGFVSAGMVLCLTKAGLIHHYSRGGALGHENGTTFERSMSGAEFADPQPSRRFYNVAFRGLDDQVALSAVNAVRRVGTYGSVVVIDDSVPRYLHLLSFLARVEQIPAWQRPSSKFADLDFMLKERLP